MNEQASAMTPVTLSTPTLPPLPKLNEIVMSFWEDLLRGVLRPNNSGDGAAPMVGDHGSGWR